MTRTADQPAATVEDHTLVPPPSQDDPVDGVLEEQLVEDVSIDGMCGVY